jgi:hypothetical protein
MELTRKYGLYIANGKENVKRCRLKEPDRTKYEIYDVIKAVLKYNSKEVKKLRKEVDILKQSKQKR